MIYVASPYTGNEEENFQQVQHFCHWCFFVEGLFIYSPIVHWHPIKERFKECGEFKTFLSYSYHMISKSDKVFVLCLKGWLGSTGVKAETQYAKSVCKPISYFCIEGGQYRVTATN